MKKELILVREWYIVTLYKDLTEKYSPLKKWCYYILFLIFYFAVGVLVISLFSSLVCGGIGGVYYGVSKMISNPQFMLKGLITTLIIFASCFVLLGGFLGVVILIDKIKTSKK